MLDAHPRLAIPDESNVFVRFYHRREEFGDLGDPARRRRLVETLLATPLLQQWDWAVPIHDVDLARCASIPGAIDQVMRAYARHFGKDVWGDKSPPYTRDLHVLNEMFPRARFIHIVRDGRDVAASLVRQWWGPNDFSAAIRYWAETASCAHRMLRMLPAHRWHELRFEDLVRDPEGELRRITAFLGLDYDPAMLSSYRERLPEKVGDKVDDCHRRLNQPVTSSQALSWMTSLPRVDQAVAHEIAGPVLREFGYPPGATRHPLKLLRLTEHRLRRSASWRFGRSRAAAARIRRNIEPAEGAPSAGDAAPPRAAATL